VANTKTVVIIAGPTAAGKTRVAIELAKHFRTEIISADSRQCFKELNIGVARPSEKELAEVPHHFIASHSIHDEMNAVVFEAYALQKVKELFKKYNAVIMAGGTGLYIKAFCEGLDNIPAIDSSVRKGIIDNYEKFGMEWLQQEVKVKDPAFYTSGEIQNPHRLMRALEVKNATGKSITEFQKGNKATRDFNIIKIGIAPVNEKLYTDIHTRVDKMMEAGLIDEVKSLHAYKNLTALQTVGYSEIFDYLENKISLPEAVEKIKISTRQYAKRQMTWFKKDAGIKWFSPDEINSIVIELSKSIDLNN
jgi:tRNA dimethylallyltransferase